MDKEAITGIREFVRAGLVSLNMDNTEDAQGNIVWTAVAQKDWTEIRNVLPESQARDIEDAIASLGELPKQCANVPDTMLDLAGVRCLLYKEALVFYKYNSSYDLVDILRVSCGNKPWVAWIENAYHRGRFSLVHLAKS